ncbi:N-acetyltransferase [Agromyces sp. G08B096]|uniref:N-acetyltransferase n=1 Tax=Agromyces sp. G08B096 TaxID=3156399 RepID=A0AAU7W7B3_9MICO
MSTKWIIRAESRTDLTTIREITLAAFTTALEADLIDALRDDPAWIRGLSLVAEDPEGGLVGHVLLTRCHIDEWPALILGPVSVRPEVQSRGVGGALIRAAISAAAERGEHAIVLVGHPGYYPRFGFERASAHGITAPIDAPDDAVMALSVDPRRALPSGRIRWAKPFNA